MTAPFTVEVGSSPFAIIPLGAIRDSRLTPREMQILGLICSHLNHERICWPSQSRIAQMARVSTQTVQKCVEHLAKAGYLRLKLRKGDGCGDDRIIIQVLYPEPEVKYLRPMGKGT